MSDETVVETDGVTVNKFFNAEDFPVPAVAFEVSSSLDEPVEFAIVDEIPDEFDIDQIGFHPEYGSEDWTATGDGVVRFERELDAGESFTTVYGVRMEDGQNEQPFLSAPAVEVGDEDIDDVVPPESTSVVRELAGGERDTVPGLEDDESLDADLDEEDLALDDDTDILGDAEAKLDAGESAADSGVESNGETTEASAGGDADEALEPGDADPELDAGDDDASGAADAPESAADSGAAVADAPGFDAGDIVGALAEAVREDEVAEEDLETLREALGGVPKSTAVEIEHLQSRVSELEAYTDALEAFIDENGAAQELLDDLEGDVAAVEDSLDDVEGVLADASDEREELREDVDALEDDVEAVDELREDVDRLAGDLEALDDRVADAEDVAMDVEALADDLEAIEDDVEQIEEWRDQLSDVFGT